MVIKGRLQTGLF